MSTLPTPPFSLSAEYIGPIFSLNATLSKRRQNVIFARNGTGKSFISRAFRCLDMFKDTGDATDSGKLLVSDESSNGRGAFNFSQGSNELGKLHLERDNDGSTAEVLDTIFHVFSEDFVDTELRETKYNISSDVNNEITIDSKNIDLKEAQVALSKSEAQYLTVVDELKKKFESEKLGTLAQKAGVNKRLTEYSALTVERLIEAFSEKPDPLDDTTSKLIADLDKLKSIPGEPIYPKEVSTLNLAGIDGNDLKQSLSKITSPSSVSDAVKQKIDAERDFFATGLNLIQSGENQECPLCEQDISSAGPKAVIDAYVAYFEAEEEKHKDELRRLYRSLGDIEKSIGVILQTLSAQSSDYDTLKVFLPSFTNTTLQPFSSERASLEAEIKKLKECITEKASQLSVPVASDFSALVEAVSSLNDVIGNRNQACENLSKKINDADTERKSIQRKTCKIFETEFVLANWTQFEKLATAKNDVKQKKSDLTAKEQNSPSADAKVRVAETFELLLKHFFGDKYAFDKDNFILKRGGNEMPRGSHRTLSDGEKTAIAFCYFVASIHKKVQSSSDYERLFLVFDDPVTSMSYDYVFAIAQTLKNLSISNQGVVSINPANIESGAHKRPRLLILTHSSYFFNILLTNKVVESNASFALQANDAEHDVVALRDYVAPFQEQLKDVYLVSEGKAPDHRTANSVRSVLEAVGRFCRPDKSDSLTNFVKFIAADADQSIKSVMINNLCHGTYYDETPIPSDVTEACKETIAVVEKYASGQLELIRKSLE